ncbi:hypothetical protein KQX54_018194 [Cotesia glomerata]|uniref:Uncharacterized protein n=1 Tax=Cotesia glomerata TaxID=32391 RepID=A0AAV7HL19_COTGL|nr:hypothetical protein KQX54_018194 [Cotesia glomerata]
MRGKVFYTNVRQVREFTVVSFVEIKIIVWRRKLVGKGGRWTWTGSDGCTSEKAPRISNNPLVPRGMNGEEEIP